MRQKNGVDVDVDPKKLLLQQHEEGTSAMMIHQPKANVKRSLQALAVTAIALFLQSQVASSETAAPGPNPPTNQVTIDAKDTNALPWTILDIPQIKAKLPIKDLFADKDTGMQIFLVKYQAGFINTWHTHPNAHVMYVLEGTLVTHQGTFGPGSLIHFPEGGWMQHGATAAGDVVILFITNKKFGIQYPSDKDLAYPYNK